MGQFYQPFGASFFGELDISGFFHTQMSKGFDAGAKENPERK